MLRRSHPHPQISGFHVLVHASRASPYATYIASIRCAFSERLARQDRSLHCSPSPAAPCQSTAKPFPVFVASLLDGYPDVPLCPSLPLPNHYSETSERAVVRNAQPCWLMTGVALVGRRMGGSTVPFRDRTVMSSFSLSFLPCPISIKIIKHTVTCIKERIKVRSGEDPPVIARYRSSPMLLRSKSGRLPHPGFLSCLSCECERRACCLWI